MVMSRRLHRENKDRETPKKNKLIAPSASNFMFISTRIPQTKDIIVPTKLH